MPSTPPSSSPHHRPSTPPASSPPSPSNPPSPSSPVDVPLLRLTSPSATRDQNRKMTDSTSNGNGLSASGFAQRERKQSNPLSQFRSNGSLRAAAQQGGASSARGTSNRFGKSSAGGSSRGGGGGRYDASSVATGTTDGDDQESESDLLGLNSPSVGGRSAGSRKRGLPGRDGNGGMPMGLGGRGESDGEFDEGWTGGLEGEEEEQAGLLGGSREQVSGPSLTGNYVVY